MKKNILSNLLLGFSLILLLVALHFSLGRKDNDDVFIFGYKPFIITTGSMLPDYPINTLVIIKETDPAMITAGEPIAFHSNIVNATVFHRVVEVTEQGFVTKGDNNEVIDMELVRPEDVLGRDVFHTTLAVYLFAIFQSPFNLIVFGVIPLVCICFAYYLIKKHFRNKE